MSLALYLREDLWKAVFKPTMKPREREIEAEEPKAPVHKPAEEGGRPAGFKPGVIHAPGVESPDPGSVGKVPAGEAAGIKESTMRIRPKGKRTTGYKRTGEEMEYKQSAWNKPPYKCKDCDTVVYPPQHAQVRTEHELMGHLASGGQWSGTHEGMHHVEHPPKLEHPKFGDKPVALTHGSVSAEHVDKKLCPACLAKRGVKTVVGRGVGPTPEVAEARAKESETKKSIAMLAQMMFLAKAMEAPEGESFGKPADTVSQEISHLIKEKGYPQKRAVAAALEMARRGKIKKDKTEKSLYLAL